MKKLLVLVLALVVVAGGGFVAYTMVWLPRHASAGGPGSAAPAAGAAANTPGSPSAPAEPSQSSGTPGQTAASGQAAAAFDGNVASLEFGATLERAPSPRPGLLSDENEGTATWASGDEPAGPKDIVISFYDRQPALIDAVEIDNAEDGPYAPRDVEIWASQTAPDRGFTKVTAAAIQATEIALVKFAPVEARFVKVRLLRSQSNGEAFMVRRIKIHEAQAPGYVSLLTRRPDILGPLVAPATSERQTASGGCEVAQTPLQPGHGESRKVLVISDEVGATARKSNFFPFPLDEQGARDRIKANPDLSIADRVEITAVVEAARAQLYMLSEAAGIDTVVVVLPCNGYPMTPLFKQALLRWVGAGHKLIVHDSDKCVPGPDYSDWLPYRIQTDTPGAKGEPGSGLRILEDNWMAHNRPGREGFIDTAAWVAGDGPPVNELGDSNVVTAWDRNWCGHMVVRNVQGVFGFVHAYAHYGRGLIIYSGIDVDATGTKFYDHLIARELAQGFAPDHLPCSIHIGSFVIATESRLGARSVEPGKTYDYPLTLLSNMKYQGTVALSASAIGASGVQAAFEPATVAVRDEQRATMKLTVPAGVRNRFAVEVKGTDTDGKTNSLCLQLGPPTGGELSIVSALAPPARTGRNLEIMLDASGSMKTAMGRKTRWAVALDTLQQVLARLPDDFNVGLRIYGHRESSRSPRTCTDSELVMPIEKLDRTAILDRARSFAPKGETPLVYSAMQAPADLKQVGGGTVILITDGEESCKGDPVKAAADLKASGLDIRLNIVGFALKDPKVQKDLAGFSQSTGGLFYSADSGATLGDALMLAAVQSFPYTIYDGSGRAVASGEAGRGSEELPPGDYKVVVKAGSREIVAPRVTVAMGQSVTLTISMKNGQLALQ
jgi:hypothetical protein